MDFKEVIEIVNQTVSMQKLLNSRGYSISKDASILCPFHADSHKSAKFYVKSNSLYCWAENRTFRAYDLLKQLGVPYAEMRELAERKKAEGFVPAPVYNDYGSLFRDLDAARGLKFGFIMGRMSVVEYIQGLESYFSEDGQDGGG